MECSRLGHKASREHDGFDKEGEKGDEGKKETNEARGELTSALVALWGKEKCKDCGGRTV